MENNTPVEQHSGQDDNSSAIFGTSSEAILQGLHEGVYIDSSPDTPGDDSKIVNEQEQQEITNLDDESPGSDIKPEHHPAETFTDKKLSVNEIEGKDIDDGIDLGDETEKARS